MINCLKYFLIPLLVFSGISYSQTDTSLVPVEFDFYKVLLPIENGVGVNGAFNNWGNNPDGTGNNAHLIPLKNIGNNNWRAVVSMSPGTYEYKFVTYQVTAGNDTIVSSWTTDPLNSNYGGPYNNSRMIVTNPMIYYLLPMNTTSTNVKTPVVSAKFSWANSSTLELSSIKFILDKVQVPNARQYYDTTLRSFSYKPPEALTPILHTAEITISTKGGDAADVSTSFSIVNSILTAPYTFVFDPMSPNVNIIGAVNKVEIKGTFNNLGSDSMPGPDSDGVYKYTVPLNIGVPNFYQFIINGGQYIDDPDNPLMESDFGTIAVKHVNPYPSFDIIYPREGQLFSPGQSISINANLVESDSGYALNNNSIKVFLDGTALGISSIDSINNGVNIKSLPFVVTPGRHQLYFVGADTINAKTQALLNFGSFAPNTGFHYVDADSDDTGPGNYTYPSFSSKGSADIKEIDINANYTNDSLSFSVYLNKISDYSRVGFSIINSLSGKLAAAPDKASIQIPDVSNKGIFFLLTAPNSTQKSSNVNKIYGNLNLTSSLDTIYVNQDAESSGVFKFSIPISLIENAAGSFAKGWYFIAYSYLGNSSGGWKVATGNGGSLFPESPNIYDAAFFYNNYLEKRNTSDYNYSFNYGGSRYVKLSSNYRGALFIRPQDISSTLALKPYLKILTDGGDIRWSDTVRIYTAINDPAITTGVLTVNSTAYPLAFINDTAYADVILSEGVNELQASAQYRANLTSYSSKVFFNYLVDHKPTVLVNKTLFSGTVTFDASPTHNVDKLPQTFTWAQDAANPVQVTFNANATSISFTVPVKRGEYFYTVNCSTTKDTSFAKVALKVDSTGTGFPNQDLWHASWIDSARIYEIFVRTFSLDGDLQAVISQISYIKSLGFNTIWLMPIYPGPAISPSQPGYAITDYFNINPLYGSLSDFKQLVNTAHANGIKVVLDYVVDHTHNTHPFMLDSYKYGPKSPYYSFYGWNPDGTYKYLYTWTDLPFIDFSLPRNRSYLLDVAKFWVENYNIDGFRCDAAAEVNDQHPGGPAFWQQFRRELKMIKADIYLLGELSSKDLDYFDQKFDSGYDYDFFNSIKNAVSNNSLLYTLDSTLTFYSGKSFPKYITPFRYLENHDQSRFISEYSVAQTKLAASVLLTLPGLPMIYAGQEVGETSYRGLIDWSDPNDLTPFYKKLVLMRKDYKSLSTGVYKDVITSSPDTIYAFARIADSLSAVFVSNFSSGNVAFSINIDSLHLVMKNGVQYYFNDVLNDTVFTFNNTNHFAVSLPSYGSKVFIFSDKSLITSVNNKTSQPYRYSLEQNYPNPFNPATTIRYTIGGSGSTPVKMLIYNILGQRVRTLIDKTQIAGNYTVQWNSKSDSGNTVASGVYFYILKVDNFFQIKKMILLK
jgi:glycosidase